MTCEALKNYLLKFSPDAEVWVSTTKDLSTENKSKEIVDIMYQATSDEIILIIKSPK